MRFLSSFIAIAVGVSLGGCTVNGTTVVPGVGPCSGKPCQAPKDGPRLKNDAGPKWPADWTLLIYAANDDRNLALTQAFDQDADELQFGVGGNALFRVLMQRDYGPDQLDASGKPELSRLYGLYREQRFNPTTMRVENPLTQEAGYIVRDETDSSDWRTLRDFLSYGIRTFPAKRYWVIISGHGDGWNGVAYDATTGPNARMSLDGVHKALTEANRVIKERVRTQQGLDGADLSRRVDIVQFDACRMASAEAAFQLSDVADFMIASQEVVPNAGHPYSALRSIAQDHSDYNPRRVVEEVVANYVRAYVDGVSTANRGYVGDTVSAVGIDLRALSALEAALLKFRDRLLEFQPTGLSCADVAQVDAVVRARAHVRKSQGDGLVAARQTVDLVTLFEALVGQSVVDQARPQGCRAKNPEPPALSLPAPVQDAAQDVLSAIGRPHVWRQDTPCGVPLQYGKQYRHISGFAGGTAGASPLVVEAHKHDAETGDRATGFGVLWGDLYLLTERKDGVSPLDRYGALRFAQRTGWLDVLGQCVSQAKACRDGQGPC